MILIAHRGNINGKSNMENHPEYILKAIKNKFDVEIDIWNIKQKWWLGHDKPEYQVSEKFLEDININSWFHCKNLNALFYMNKNYKYFWHENDNYTLTSNGYIWTYPNKNFNNKCIIVDNVVRQISKLKIVPFGICSDYVSLIN